jgi:hypothetical protein
MITILALTIWANVLVSGSLARLNTVAQPAKTVSTNTPVAQDAVPYGWRKIDAYGKFTFYLPPNMHDTGVTGMENLHREYTNGRLHLSYDYDPFGYLAYEKRALAYGKDFQEIELQVDGRKAFLFLHQGSDLKKRRTYDADLFVGDLPNHDVILHMWTMSWSARHLETAKTIFRTIKFSNPSGR